MQSHPTNVCVCGIKYAPPNKGIQIEWKENYVLLLNFFFAYFVRIIRAFLSLIHIIAIFPRKQSRKIKKQLAFSSTKRWFFLFYEIFICLCELMSMQDGATACTLDRVIRTKLRNRLHGPLLRIFWGFSTLFVWGLIAVWNVRTRRFIITSNLARKAFMQTLNYVVIYIVRWDIHPPFLLAFFLFLFCSHLCSKFATLEHTFHSCYASKQIYMSFVTSQKGIATIEEG